MDSSQQFEWIVFDAVGTLITPEPSVEQAYWNVGQEFDSQLGLEEVRRRFHQEFANSFSTNNKEDRITSEEIEYARWKQIVARVLDDVSDRDACFSRVHDHFANPHAWSVYDDVEPALSTLKREGYRLAIASNFDQRLHAVCQGKSALKCVDAIFTSAELGFQKPSQKFYRQLSRQLGAPPSSLMMVGDQLQNDLRAAQATELTAYLVDRDGRHPEERHRVSDLSEILNLV